MIFYLYFSFWEFVLRIVLSFIVFWLHVLRLVFFVSVPIVMLIVASVIVAKIAFRLTQIPSDESRSPTEIISTRGFKPEIHTVTTADGYILTMYRVMNPFVDKEERVRKPVLLMHGLGTHGLMWLLNDDTGCDFKDLLDPHQSRDEDEMKRRNRVEDSLGFELAKRGYDVWLGNQRGNRFSQRHETMNSNKDERYWNFSLDEISMFDLPSMMKYILAETNQKTLSYIGFSQGATVMFSLLSSQPRYNDIVRPFVAIAPIVRTQNSKYVTSFGKYIIQLAPQLAHRFPGRMYPGFVEFLTQLFFCHHSLESLSNVVGKYTYASKFLNTKRVSTFMAFRGIHCSRKNMAHYFQLVNGDFSRFNYGSSINQKVYGYKEPPKYELGNITNPWISLIFSKDDTMAGLEDVKHLRSQLTAAPLMDVFVVKKKKWDHEDFMLGKDCGKHVNSRIVLHLEAFYMDFPTSPSTELVKDSDTLSVVSEESCSIESKHNVTSTIPSPTNVLMDLPLLVHKEHHPHHSGYNSSSSSSSFDVILLDEAASILKGKRKDQDGTEKTPVSTTLRHRSTPKVGTSSSYPPSGSPNPQL